MICRDWKGDKLTATVCTIYRKRNKTKEKRGIEGGQRASRILAWFLLLLEMQFSEGTFLRD
jgi:hypothetical protein